MHEGIMGTSSCRVDTLGVRAGSPVLQDPGTREAVHVPSIMPRAQERGPWDPSQEGKGMFVYTAGVPDSGMLS